MVWRKNQKVVNDRSRIFTEIPNRTDPIQNLPNRTDTEVDKMRSLFSLKIVRKISRVGINCYNRNFFLKMSFYFKIFAHFSNFFEKKYDFCSVLIRFGKAHPSEVAFPPKSETTRNCVPAEVLNRTEDFGRPLSKVSLFAHDFIRQVPLFSNQ